MAVFQDITDTKLSIIKLEEANKLADEANNAKNTFLSTISHEIRTPLNAIIGYSNLLQNTGLNSKQDGYNQKITISSELLLNLVNDILDLTKIDAKKLVINKEELYLEKIVKTICEVQKFKAHEQGLYFNIEIEDGIPTKLIGDELRLSQVLLNIVNNAIKFTHQGGITFKISRENIISETNNSMEERILFSIKDTGIGISPENQEKLFMPFEQVQNTNKRKYGGTGLGLVISKQLIDLMGGIITVESSEGKGSIFNICIPFGISTDEKPEIINLISPSANINTLANISVLMVEDNIYNAEILMTQLLERNLNVSHAESGEIALELLKKHTYDIIIMDIEMPVMDGFETTQRIKDMGLSNIPIIALSAHSLDSDKTKALQVGMASYLSKPVKVETLLGVIHEYTKTPKPNHKTVTHNNFINKDNGLEYFDGDEHLFNRALKRFKESYQKTQNDILDIFENDKASLKILTHNLKSGSKMIGAEALCEKASHCDQILRIDVDLLTKDEVMELSKALGNTIDSI